MYTIDPVMDPKIRFTHWILSVIDIYIGSFFNYVRNSNLESLYVNGYVLNALLRKYHGEKGRSKILVNV